MSRTVLSVITPFDTPGTAPGAEPNPTVKTGTDSVPARTAHSTGCLKVVDLERASNGGVTTKAVAVATAGVPGTRHVTENGPVNDTLVVIPSFESININVSGHSLTTTPNPTGPEATRITIDDTVDFVCDTFKVTTAGGAVTVATHSPVGPGTGVVALVDLTDFDHGTTAVA